METLRAEHIETFEDIRDWARRLHRAGPHPAGIIRRYAIGLYQLHQATDWGSSDSGYESTAAAIIHILAATEAADIPIEVFLPRAVLLSPREPGHDDSFLLYNVSRLQQQLIYYTNKPTLKRASRFNRESAGNAAGCVIKCLVGRIPAGKVPLAMYTAMAIMTGEL